MFDVQLVLMFRTIGEILCAACLIELTAHFSQVRGDASQDPSKLTFGVFVVERNAVVLAWVVRPMKNESRVVTTIAASKDGVSFARPFLPDPRGNFATASRVKRSPRFVRLRHPTWSARVRRASFADGDRLDVGSPEIRRSQAFNYAADIGTTTNRSE